MAVWQIEIESSRGWKKNFGKNWWLRDPVFRSPWQFDSESTARNFIRLSESCWLARGNRYLRHRSFAVVQIE